MRPLRVLLCLLLSLSMAGCTTSRIKLPEEVPPSVPPVGSVMQQRVPALAPPLDIGVAVFDQGLGNNEGMRVFPTVRKAESLLLPVALSEALEDSGAWGVVRVVHSPDVYMPLIVEGEIIRANGSELELHIRLRSADGATLLDKLYRDEASGEDYRSAKGRDAFADMYRAVANDILAQATALSETQRQVLARLSLMRFAADVSPATFTRFVQSEPNGRFGLLSFPADGDPMLRRLDRIRRQDELFVDTVDQQYSDLRDKVHESYALWRQYSFELENFGDDYIASAASRKSSARRGSYAAMQQDYARYRKVKVQEDDLGDLVTGFAGDSLETVLEVDDGVFRLSGSVNERYDEWRRILGRIYDLETGQLNTIAR